MSNKLCVREVVLSYKTSRKGIAISGPNTIAAILPKLLTTNTKEHFIAFYLDGSHQIVSYSVVSIGTATAAMVHPREAFQPAIAVGAVAVIVAHNHPSGSLKISDSDRVTTKRIADAGEILGIKLLDHIIFTADGSFVSMKNVGEL